MSIADSLLAEFDQEMATTRKHLERTPAQHADWKPHPKSMSLGGLAIHIALWFTVFQQEVSPEARSRVSSYDALGSLMMMPVGFAVAGPTAAAIGTAATLWGIFALELASLLAVLAIPAVWGIRRARPGATEVADV